MEPMLVEGKFSVRLDRRHSRLVLFSDGKFVESRTTDPDDSHGSMMIDVHDLLRNAEERLVCSVS